MRLMRGAEILSGLLGLSIVLGVGTCAQAQSLTLLGKLPGHSVSEAYDVSDDGRVVVGWSGTGTTALAFRWTSSGGMQNLGTLTGFGWSKAYGVSADGRVIVGVSTNANGQRRACLWLPSFNNPAIYFAYDLGTLGGAESEAWAVSADGSVIVGVSTNTSGRRRACLWKYSIRGFNDETGQPAVRVDLRLDLGTLAGYTDASEARGVSADGGVVVGFSSLSTRSRACRWIIRNNAVQRVDDLGTLGGDSSVAYDISDDGGTVVGGAADSSGWLHAFIHQGSMRVLGSSSTVAYAVAEYGEVIVGTAVPGRQSRALRWTSGGQEDLNATYASLLPQGSLLRDAHGISRNGRYIVGSIGPDSATGGIDQAFLLDTARCSTHRGDINRDGCVDDNDLLIVLFNFGRSGTGLGREDVNCDGNVDDADLLIVLFNFGQC